MGFSALDVIKALILKLFLEVGDCLHNYVMLNRSISKGEENVQNPKITQRFHCWKYQESRHTPLSFLLITLWSLGCRKNPTAGKCRMAQIPLKNTHCSAILQDFNHSQIHYLTDV